MNQLTGRGKSSKRIGLVRDNKDVLVYDDHENQPPLIPFLQQWVRK